MSAGSEHDAALIEGQLLQLGEQHAVAIYRREGTCWVAEFRAGSSALVDASTWFHFHAVELRHSHGRRAAGLRSAAALTPQVIEEIQRLHREAALENAQTPARSVAAHGTLQRCWIAMIVALRGARSSQASDIGAHAPALARVCTWMVGGWTRETTKASNIKSSFRNLGLFALCLAAMFTWIGVLASQLAPYVPEHPGTTLTPPADNTTD